MVILEVFKHYTFVLLFGKPFTLERDCDLEEDLDLLFQESGTEKLGNPLFPTFAMFCFIQVFMPEVPDLFPTSG